ncbi:hypothetical protein [Streptomyces sp. NPDC040750]|uniref:hypothetical protein n=1 Tax=Streptomyces sp. NPDC040750 TaxID=3154491 RepID=UPI0033EEDD24
MIRGKTNESLYHTMFDGSSWTGFTVVPEATAAKAPALVTHQDSYGLQWMYCMFPGPDDYLYETAYHGVNPSWNVRPSKTSLVSSNTPAIGSLGDRSLHCIYRG